MTVRNLAPTTQASYVQQVSMFARHFGQSPELLGLEEIRQIKNLSARALTVNEAKPMVKRDFGGSRDGRSRF